MHLLPLNTKAFTLVELIVVMALIAVTASFAVPQIANFLFTDQLKVSVRKLVGLIHRTSQLAQQQQIPYLLTYQQRERVFTVRPEIIEENTAVERKENRLQLDDSVAVRDLWSWYGGRREADAFVIRFTKNGYVEPTIVHMHRGDGEDLSVILSPFLGKVQVVSGYVQPDKERLFQ